MKEQELLPHLFRTEYRKLTSVLGKLFGLEHIEIAEDIASDTFLLASETWSLKGLPENPTAWLYAVAKNKAKDFLKRNTLFDTKIKQQFKHSSTTHGEFDLDLSLQNISDSQLQMMFAIMHPSVPPEAQIGLALRILCGFGIEEIAHAFLSNKETINKRLFRAKEVLREEQVKIEVPNEQEISQRLNTVLTTLYLLFNEGYYASRQDTTIRRDLCLEAMRLTHLLTENPQTDKAPTHALLALMCFHASRFEARIGRAGENIVYQEQDSRLWNTELMERGNYYLLKSKDAALSKFHLEAGIAYWHTQQTDTPEKWNSILQLYNQLLLLEYSPMAALNRTYALSKVKGKEEGIVEAEKLQLTNNHLYHSLLGELYMGIDNQKAIAHFKTVLSLSKSTADKAVIAEKIKKCEEKRHK